MLMCFFFFFKQKTAYEMRISDWSSDVCSSDLAAGVQALVDADRARGGRAQHLRAGQQPGAGAAVLAVAAAAAERVAGRRRSGADGAVRAVRAGLAAGAVEHVPDQPLRSVRPAPGLAPRSEEHTSELQSLMRISYAVFCLKKKTHKQTHQQP